MSAAALGPATKASANGDAGSRRGCSVRRLDFVLRGRDGGLRRKGKEERLAGDKRNVSRTTPSIAISRETLPVPQRTPACGPRAVRVGGGQDLV